jgi:hypothetical protein
MTEEEANRKWCPAIRLTAANLDWCTNRGDNPKVDGSIFCIGSGCMAWRWFERITNKDALDRERNSFMSMPKVVATYENTEHGYCGLAGKEE